MSGFSTGTGTFADLPDAITRIAVGPGVPFGARPPFEMWTRANRGFCERRQLRYPTDLTDAEWELVAPLRPPARRGGGKRTVDMRAVVNGLMSVLGTGCQWRALPKDLPARSTVRTAISGTGATTAPWTGCTMPSMSDAVTKRAARPPRPPRSSTARASRAEK